MSADEDSLKGYTETLLRETREELGHADGKASLLFAATGVVLAAFLAGVINGKWSPGDLAGWATVAFAIGAFFYVISLAALGYAVWPRITHEEEARPADYFGDIVNYKGAEKRAALKEALRRGAANSERATAQLLIVSCIVWRKYAGIRVAVGCFVLSVIACSTAILGG